MPDVHFEAANRFALIARRYCELIERSSGMPRVEFLQQTYELLAELLIEASRLPADPITEDDQDEALASLPGDLESVGRVEFNEWSRIYESLKTTLGDWNLYWEVFDPRTDAEALRGSLADDLGDVYRDLKNGLALQGAGPESVLKAIFTWRVDFWSHWGEHATDSLRVIHRYLGEID